MKNLKQNFALLALVMGVGTMMFFSSCSKGDKGATGAAGPDSVMYSSWTTLAMTQGVDTYGDTFYTQTITAPAITDSILNSGSVIGYLLVSDPLTVNGDSSVVNAALAFTEYFSVGKIDLLSYGTDYSGLDYRYVVIPGKIATSSVTGKTYTVDQLKKMSYSQVTTLFPTKSRLTN